MNLQVPQGCRSPGRCWPYACEDAFEGGEYVSSSGTGAAGWDEDNLGDFENSVVDGVACNVLGDANIVVAAARRGRMLLGVIR